MTDKSQCLSAVMLCINVYPTKCRKLSVWNILQNSTIFHIFLTEFIGCSGKKHVVAVGYNFRAVPEYFIVNCGWLLLGSGQILNVGLIQLLMIMQNLCLYVYTHFIHIYIHTCCFLLSIEKPCWLVPAL